MSTGVLAIGVLAFVVVAIVGWKKAGAFDDKYDPR
jgi:hypothetical protein